MAVATDEKVLSAIFGERQISEACEQCPCSESEGLCTGCVFAKAETLDPDLDVVDFMSQLEA